MDAASVAALVTAFAGGLLGILNFSEARRRRNAEVKHKAELQSTTEFVAITTTYRALLDELRQDARDKQKQIDDLEDKALEQQAAIGVFERETRELGEENDRLSRALTKMESSAGKDV